LQSSATENRRMRMVNPQAMAAVSSRKQYTGHPALGVDVDRDTWLTPRYILDVLGPFDLDPCAALASPRWAAKHGYTVADNGLEQSWHGRVFMNPPFSDTSRWLARHAQHGEGISLVPATVESVVWRKYVWTRATTVFLLHGRTRFCNPDGSATMGRPLRSIALIAWTPHDRLVLQTCGLAGVLIRDWKQT
jgi:hypothetical protein